MKNDVKPKANKSANPGHGASTSSVEFDRLVENALSIRAQHALQRIGVRDARALMDLTSEDLIATEHCGEKTTNEIINFGTQIRAGTYDLSPDQAKQIDSGRCFPGELEALAVDAAIEGLSRRGRSALARLGVTSIDGLISLPLSDISSRWGAGEVTIDEIHNIKNVVIDFLKVCDQIEESERIPELCKQIFAKTVSSAHPWMLDPDRPYKMLLQWVGDIAGHKKNAEKAFLYRTGLSGQPAMTLERSGRLLGITRERVRQLNKEFKEAARWIVYQDRLRQIIERMKQLVTKAGGRMPKEELLASIAESKAAAEKFSNAKPLLDFMADFKVWKASGMGVDKKTVFLEDSQ